MGRVGAVSAKMTVKECVFVASFIIGLVILIGGAALYGRFCEKVFGPDDRKTPAYTKEGRRGLCPHEGLEEQPDQPAEHRRHRPHHRAHQGILFGPIAFITIPIGNIIGGAMHDYFSGMICLRDGGTQMPEMIRRYSTKGIYQFYNVFVCVLLLLVGAVFIYTPGDIAATQVFDFDGKATDPTTWIIYGVIFLYYLIATVFPIDAIIGKIYPIFGGILLFSAIGIFIGIFVTGMPLLNIWDGWAAAVLSLTGADGTVGTFTYADYFSTKHFLPIFFVTVACGILRLPLHPDRYHLPHHEERASGPQHLLQHDGAGRLHRHGLGCRRHGRVQSGLQEPNARLATGTVGVVCKYLLGHVGGIIALLGVIVLPITSGDTALRALRLSLSETLHIDQSTNGKRIKLACPSLRWSSPSWCSPRPTQTASTSCGVTSHGPTRPCPCSPS